MLPIFRRPWELNPTQVFLTVASLLGFWLSASVILDGVVIPCLYANGMMMQSGFAAAAYSLFEVFNHLEIVLGAIVVALLLSLGKTLITVHPKQSQMVGLAVGLFAIALAYTYWLTPDLSAWGLVMEDSLGARSGMPEPMVITQVLYWSLEVVKFFGGAWLLNQCLNAGLDSIQPLQNQ